MKKNIVYRTDSLARYFTHHRIAWPHFYASERNVIEQLSLDQKHAVLDIGCGCGGLGLALRDRFGVCDYTGVEINASAAEAGRLMNSKAKIICGDIIDLSRDILKDKLFDVVFSLSCVDWNVRFTDMLSAAWNHVAPGGYLVSTFRLTEGEGCQEFENSYQYINFEGALEGERAAYVVLNAKTLMGELAGLNPSAIRAFGYWGEPSASAVTPYKRLCFAAFSIRKRRGEGDALQCRLELPAEILDVIGRSSR
jgi:SAM-dependent methyltransferase